MAVGEYLNSSYIDDVVGTFLTSFVVVVVMIFGCAVCRKKGQIIVRQHKLTLLLLVS